MIGQGFDTSRFRFNDLELIADKREYAPGEKVRLLVNANRLDSTVVLFVRPGMGVDSKPQVVRIKGKSSLVEIGVAQKDMPTFFVQAITISEGRVYTETREIVVPPEQRVAKVVVQSSAHDYKPGAKAAVKLKLTDLAGKPVVGSVVLAVYDKSVEYVSGGTNIPEIREFFWNWRRSTNMQTESNLERESENLVKPGETPMRGIGIFDQLPYQGSGNGVFGGAAGGRFVGVFGSPVVGTPVGMPGPARLRDADSKFKGKESGKKSGEPADLQPTIRTQFADTAFWAARLKSDRDGLAEVSFPMPENLTTWKIRSWTMSAGTRVGQGEAEIVTTKNLLVRLQAPRFFVEQDEVVLSANVHNRLKTAKSVRVVLELEGKSLSRLGEAWRDG